MRTSKELADETGKQHGEVRRVIKRLKECGLVQYHSEEEVKAAGGKGGRNQKLFTLSDEEYERIKRHIACKKHTPPQLFTTKAGALNTYKTSRQLAAALGRTHNNAVAFVRRVVSKGWLPGRMFADDYYEKHGRKYREIGIEFMAYEWLLDYAKCVKVEGRAS
jgi:predicted ArsR family transcriptional regulator